MLWQGLITTKTSSFQDEPKKHDPNIVKDNIYQTWDTWLCNPSAQGSYVHDVEYETIVVTNIQ